jgi:collagenase-like PrtC family protease
MKVVAPIASADEVRPLAEAGADEFYCGLVPEEWSQRYGISTLNRRRGGNMTSFAELERALDTAHELGRQIAVVFNAQAYGAHSWDVVLALAEAVAERGADAAIVADVGLLAALAERELPLRLHLSSVASCHNIEAASLFHDLGAARIILPRHVTLAEMAAFTAALPGVEFEAFVLNDGCVFEEGSCHTLHLPPELGGPICMDGFRYDHRRTDGRPVSDTEESRLAENAEAYRAWLWYTFACGFSLTENGLPHGPCGFCAVPDLEAAGIAALKITGREGHVDKRLRSVELVRRVLDRHDASGNATALRGYAQGLRDKPELCTTGYMCYYRDALPAKPLEANG